MHQSSTRLMNSVACGYLDNFPSIFCQGKIQVENSRIIVWIVWVQLFPDAKYCETNDVNNGCFGDLCVSDTLPSVLIRIRAKYCLLLHYKIQIIGKHSLLIILLLMAC